MFRALLESISDRLPSQCLVCRSWPGEPLCEACIARFAQPCARCQTCAMPVPSAVLRCGACIRDPPPLDACVAAVPYAYPWAGLIVQFKFHPQPGHARALAAVLRHAPWVEPALDHADHILPMPLSTQRLRTRGFNQALELARRLAPDKTDAGLLLRIRDTAPQSALSRTERLHNVRHAFAVEPTRAGELVGRRIVLVDDVMTSGASLHAAATALRRGGAQHVTALVLARADLGRP
ncbi:MAG: ComF family protein [Rhodoferax sp.]|nr:ComF family protein [Rhodoferax sp.]